MQIEALKEVSYKHTRKIICDTLTALCYDLTTLHFQAEQKEALPKLGFSEEGKHQQSQVVPGLWVSEEGYPVDYIIFEGNK